MKAGVSARAAEACTCTTSPLPQRQTFPNRSDRVELPEEDWPLARAQGLAITVKTIAVMTKRTET